MHDSEAIGLFLARLLMSCVFLFSAIEKLRKEEEEIQAIVGLHLPYPNFVAMLAGLCEIVGASMLVFGVGARLASVLLALFLVSVTIIFLQFWKAPTRQVRFGQANAFFGNLGLVGGLTYVALIGPGPLAIFPRL
ncbi:DoxX family protein [Variovorax paradoxus]|uniref:DoxX family protein n=1 Tax=Variovorax paradoxus TaxID=34073 RepID=UPI003ECE360D